MSLAEETSLAIEERLFSVEEALGAEEAFITSASSIVMPVVAIDDTPVGTGRPGPLTLRLRELYLGLAQQAKSAAA